MPRQALGIGLLCSDVQCRSWFSQHELRASYYEVCRKADGQMLMGFEILVVYKVVGHCGACDRIVGRVVGWIPRSQCVYVGHHGQVHPKA